MSLVNDTLRHIIRTEVIASGPITIKEISNYLKENFTIKYEVYEIVEEINTLIRKGEIEIGEEGNTFQVH